MSDMLINFSSLEKTKIVKPTHKKKKSAKNVSSIEKESNLDSKGIVEALTLRFINHKYLINNAYIYQWESDFFSVSEAGYIYEFEIKISRGDFKDDFNKVDKHQLLESTDPNTVLKKPNKFFYAVPKGLLSSISIPEYAGLLEIDPETKNVTTIKEAPFLHKEKGFDALKDILIDKFYFRYRDLLAKSKE
jgi:hypothetical protein